MDINDNVTGDRVSLQKGLILISVTRLTKTYGPVVAVDQVSFEVKAGQIVGFLGPNGAGKSTTLRMLTTYLPPTSGQAHIDGLDVFHDSMKVRQILGYLPENVPLYGEMRVDEYLEFRGRLRKMERATRRHRIDHVCSTCWLTEVRRRPIAQLSKGYRQRVGLADALLHNPKVLILDEPTVGLDPAQIRETRKLIRGLGGQHTILLSTHILSEVETVCDHALIIAGGKIVAHGSPDELRSSRRMQARVLVECRGPTEEIQNVLARLSGVSKVVALDGKTHDGFITLAVRPREQYDVREEIAHTVIQHGWPLREIRLEHATLEEFFVQVTAQ